MINYFQKVKNMGKFSWIPSILLIFLFLLGLNSCNLKRDKNQGESMIIGFAGDTMLGRLVNETISMTNYNYPWGNVLLLLKENDLNVINLETTLTRSKKKVPKVFNFKADPDKVQTLVNGRIDVVNLANNHSLDFSEEGLIETINTLDKHNIKHVGAGPNEAKAKEAVIITKNNIRIGIIGYTDNEPGWQAEKNKAGSNYIRVGDIEEVKQDAKKVRSKVNLLIVSIHWGPNKRQRPTQDFIDFAHQMIDCGIDIIHGHSAHIFQGIEIYKNKIIMYDTGDFVDDYMVYPILRNDQSFLFKITADKSGPQSIELIPVIINNMQVNVATGEMAKNILNKMKKLSEEFQTKVKIENERGLISIK